MKEFSAQLENLLDDYVEDVQKSVDEAAEQCAKDAVSDLKANSPKRNGAYARSWAVKKDGHGYIVHNKKHYQLTHLLENGHVLVSYGKTRGRVGAKPHIAPVADKEGRNFVNSAKLKVSK